MKRTLTLAVLVGCLALVPALAAAGHAPVSGTVTVENGTADGAQVTVVPVSENLQRVDTAATTTVNGSSFAVDVADAPQYVVRVDYGGASHFDVIRNDTSATIALSESVSGRVVADDGSPRANATVELADETGFLVDQSQTDSNGTFAFGPLESNETYLLRVTVDGVPYQQSVNASSNGSVTISTPPPTNDSSVLTVANGTQTAYVMQVVPPQNESGVPSVVETVTLRNTADRPFAGQVSIRTPDGSTPYAAMVQGEEAAYEQTDTGVRLDVTIPANGTTQVGAAYDLTDSEFEKELGRDTSTLAVVIQGYEPTQVEHSENLRVGDAPVSLLTNSDPIADGETVRVDLSGARSQATTNESAANNPSESSSIPSFPGTEILAVVSGMVFAGLAVYRVTPLETDEN